MVVGVWENINGRGGGEGREDVNGSVLEGWEEAGYPHSTLDPPQ